ncbi:MAG: acetate--CoA ligase family protein [Longimicrobiales bacterium]|nr:acetate--CoA ligase family protein [Longimicrobiales bacterium]
MKGVFLLEDAGMALARSAGLEVPRHRVVASPGEVDEALLAEFPGPRVVAKLLTPELPHRTEAGGVRVIAREPGAVRQLMAGWEARFGWARPRFLLAEYVAPDPDAVEILLGYRINREFGPVVTVAPGGVLAELTAGALRAGQGPVHVLAEALAGGVDERTRTRLAERAFLAPVLHGVRGRAPLLGVERFLEVLGGIAALARAGRETGLEEFEVNPVRITAGRAVALDALGRYGVDGDEAGGVADRTGLDVLFRPGTLAVAGVSATAMNPGRVILRNILAAGFPPERVQVVKAGVAEVDGVRTVPSAAALDPAVDLLVVAVPAPRVPALVEAAVATGRARGLVLIPGGLEEGFHPGEETPADRIRRALASAVPQGRAAVAVGSNCLGIRSVPGRFDTLFIPARKLGFPDTPPAPVALLSQSGAFAIARASALPGLNPRYIVTLGTQLDVTLGEVLEHLLDDPELETAACYVEGFRPGDGARFGRAAAAWRAAGRRVILYRGGRSPAGREAAASHTAALAGDYDVTREVCATAGVDVVDTVEGFQDRLLAAALLTGRQPGGRVGFVSNAGFECVALADHATPLRPATFAPGTVAGLEALLAEARLDGVVRPRNPLDVTPILGDGGFVAAVERVLADPGVDVAVVGLVPLTPALQTLPGGGEDLRAPGAVAEGLAALWRRSRKPWVVAVDAGPAYDPLRVALASSGVPVFTSADRAVRALAAWAALG